MGRVKSLIYRNGNTYKKEQRIMTASDNGHGYKIVGLRKPGQKRKNHYIHRLVAEAFIPNPENYKYINHKDYNRNNNVFNNLEWCTQSYNVKYSIKHYHNPHSRPVAKIDPASNQLLEIYNSIEEASRRTGTSTTFIAYCCKGKCKLAKRVYVEIYIIKRN